MAKGNFRRNGLVFATALTCIAALVAGLVLAIVAEREAVTLKKGPKTYKTVTTGQWSDAQYPRIHSSCDSTDVDYITKAFADTHDVTSYAKEQLSHKNSVDSEVYKRWFGDGKLYEVLGVVEGLANISKTNLLLRCDDADGLCAKNPNYYAGYHREADMFETVICDYFYEARVPLTSMCTKGNITQYGPTKYAGIDLLHRYFHISSISQNEFIGEFTDDLDETLDLAEHNSTFAVRNVDNYLYFLADVWGNKVKSGGCFDN
ncbi:LANO_0F17546g1_1 [Lachancea nothofagi CBS 11611]|uniref:LANO_0F17546g1_1 n=1 Tax=Lachancea nothofagi CBS 11611 TaxID=1266666 RepID=A0A1G4KD18_9SACH|nr:LANO_0F17546g1_1 [Lachancea nothofagi CBS 11611]